MEKWIDLTLTLDEFLPVYPGDIPIRFDKDKTLEKDGYNLTRITSGMHVGTLMDSKKHMLDSDEGIDKIDPNLLIGEALIIRPSLKENVISTKDVINQYDLKSKILIFDLDFARRLGEDAYFKYPKFERNILPFLLQNQVQVICMDFPSPEYEDEVDFEMHKDLLSKGIYIIENLTNINTLKSEIDFIALPLKLRDMDGSLIRCVARNR